MSSAIGMNSMADAALWMAPAQQASIPTPAGRQIDGDSAARTRRRCGAQVAPSMACSRLFIAGSEEGPPSVWRCRGEIGEFQQALGSRRHAGRWRSRRQAHHHVLSST
jgi:hypothetical protein